VSKSVVKSKPEVERTCIHNCTANCPDGCFTTAEPAPLLNLAEGRVVAMTFGARTYTWTFRRILRADWEKFFRSFDTETVTILGEQTETFEIESGLVDLARTCVASVDGYKLPDAGDWKKMLPLGHLKQFGNVLRDVRAVPPADDAEIELSELSEISLDCFWSGSRWSGLAHRFRTPTLAQQRKFNRACGTYRVMGNDRGNKTIFPARQALMMDFYDELIESVDESYAVDGQPLSTREEIVAQMDCCHKIAAIQGLLNAGGTGTMAKAADDK
jgi:hypothetical protein